MKICKKYRQLFFVQYVRNLTVNMNGTAIVSPIDDGKVQTKEEAERQATLYPVGSNHSCHYHKTNENDYLLFQYELHKLRVVSLWC